MKRNGFLVVLCLCMGLAVPVGSHVPEAVTFLAYQFAEGNEPRLDGDLSEWAVVPDSYVLWVNNHTEFSSGAPGTDFSNLWFRIIVGWSDHTNRLYFMMERLDDVYDRDGEGHDDGWEIQVDADHGGGSIWVSTYESSVEQERAFDSGRWNQAWRFALPPLEREADNNRGWKWFWMSQATWTDELPWSDFGFRMEGEIGGKATTYHEYMTAVWDDLDWRSAEDSKEHDLEAFEVIGLNWGVHDFDVLGADNPREGYWTLNGADDGWRTANSAADFLLAPVDYSEQPTGVEEVSWGRIKEAFLRP